MGKKTHLPVYHSTVLSSDISAAWEAQLHEETDWARFVPRQKLILFERFTKIYPRLCALPRHFRRRLQRNLGASLASVALTLALGHTPPALAAQISVETNIPDINPDGQCSLIEAIINANDDAATHLDCSAGNGKDTIELRNRIHLLTGPYAGENGLPVVTSAITVAGNGATIEWPEGTPPFTVFEVANSGDLTLDETTIIGNYKYSQAYGAGILNNGGALTLKNSTVREMYDGISIRGENATPTTIVTNSTIRGSYGNGISSSAEEGTLTLNNSTIIGNDGDGINITGSELSELTVNNSTISGNDDEGVAMRGTNATITNSTITGNEFLGIYLEQGASLTMLNSTVTGNHYAGVDINDSSAVLERTVVSGNFHYENTFSEVSVHGGTLVANNFNLFGHDGVSNAEVFVGFTPGATDITATSDGTQPTALGNILDTTPRNNGGPTLTHALILGSPAIDAAGPDCPPPDTDQRGVVRPQGTACDIGAFEFNKPVDPNKPDLVIEEFDYPDPAMVDGPLTYTLRVRNAGLVTARKVRVLDTLPRSVKLISIPENCKLRRRRVICKLGDLDSGAEHRLNIRVEPGKPGKIINRAKVKFKGKDADPSDNKVKQVTTVRRR